MEYTVQSILETFERLGANEQLQVVHPLLLRTRELDLPALDDETIHRLAEESFLAYDADEAADEPS